VFAARCIVCVLYANCGAEHAGRDSAGSPLAPLSFIHSLQAYRAAMLSIIRSSRWGQYVRAVRNQIHHQGGGSRIAQRGK
jgi:hypothetical protein